MIVYRAIEALKSQLERAKNDMDILSRLRDRVLAEPQEYVKSLVSGKEPAAPCQQEVVDIPLINMEPYVLFAHPAVSESYIRSLRGRSASSRGDISAATHSGALSKPSVTGAMTNTSGANGLRSLGVDKSAGVSGKAGKYALRHNHSVSPSAALPGPLTGNTAVATPEQSPPRPQSSAGHLSNINNGISTPSTAIAAIAAISAIPVTASSRILASSADSHAEQSSSVPPIGRSNTEPVHRHAAAQSVPGTPSSRGRSQKTLTPQILEDFRRQISEERSITSGKGDIGLHKETGNGQDNLDGEHDEDNDDDDDDEYYNRLVESAVSEYSGQLSEQRSTNDNDGSERTVAQRGAGKSLLLSGINHASEYLQPQYVRSAYMVDHYESDLDDFMESDQERRLQKIKSQNLQCSAGKRKRGRPKKGAAPQPPYVRQRVPRKSANADPSKPKPASYNMPWTDEEQERLEQLLIEYPEEEVANSRWRKISEALGTRSMRQVASRVQKYFIKLAKAGLPVPGRVPNTEHWTSAAKTRSITPSRSGKTGGSGSGSGSGSGKKMDGRGKKRKYVDFTSSSGESSGSEDIEIDLGGETSEGEGQAFGAAVPYDHKGKQADRSAGTALDSANDLYGFANDDDFLKAVVGEGGSGSMVDSQRFFNPASTSKANQQSLALRSAKAVHLGYRCDSCLAEPIVGIRWHCMECRGAHAVDLCDECREEGNFETGWHNTAHTFHAVREAEMEPYYANEVASCALQEYSYLA
ncbi:hypothetical protein LPJ64_005196 [Coemansia asiatica]|uniref:ZZ-type zinc finger-containing protein 3 n=1 Tax=Coemansia asiatica TaxID=1052880 RepID=A0A9W7XEU8_9FUNG|nr:hypothetical protein LPJ64_005196 [Coemansia asiatica]